MEELDFKRVWQFLVQTEIDEVTIFSCNCLFTSVRRLGQIQALNGERVFLEHPCKVLSRRHSVLINSLVEEDVRLWPQRVRDLCPEERDGTSDLNEGT